jgi:hypothetical protein
MHRFINEARRWPGDLRINMLENVVEAWCETVEKNRPRVMGGGLKLSESFSDLAYYFLRPHLDVFGNEFDCANWHASDNDSLCTVLRARFGGWYDGDASNGHVVAAAVRAQGEVISDGEARQFVSPHDKPCVGLEG